MNKLDSKDANKINGRDIAGIINAGKASYKKPLKEMTQEVKSEGNNGEKITGVVIAKISAVKENGRICVDFSLNALPGTIAALTLSDFSRDDVGREVAVMFQNGDPQRPVVIGPIIQDDNNNTPEPEEFRCDQKTITLTAEEDIVLRCGKASITLTRAGKIILRGRYILSRSSGVNSIKGGSVDIN